MPRCEGLSSGPCPDSKCDASVQLGEGDLLLCPECDAERRREFSLSATSRKILQTVTDATADDHDDGTHNELLCFLQQKAKLMAFDHIIQICSSFYASDDIKKAQNIVSKIVKHRLPMHKGADKDRKTLVDLLKICLDPTMLLPVFSAVRIDRLPPVGIEHVDVSALLQELTLLRSEVKAVAELRTEMAELKSCLQALSLQCDRSPPSAKPPQLSTKPSLLSTTTTRDRGPEQKDQPQLSQVGDDVDINTGETAAQKLMKAVHSGEMQTMQARQQARRPKALVGMKTGTKIKTVQTRKTVDVFLSRLSPETEDNEVVACTTDALGVDLDLSLVNVRCFKLNAKFDSYSSYHVAVSVDSGIFGRAIELLMSNEAWPAGVLVRRYFNKKNG